MCPSGWGSPVIGPSSWPGLALSYTLAPSPAELRLTLGFDPRAYVPSSAVPVAAAVAAVAGDLARFGRIEAQGGVAFAVQTTLATGDAGDPVDVPLPGEAFAGWVRGVRAYLEAWAGFEPATFAVPADDEAPPSAIADVVAELGVTGAALFAANAEAAYASLFGTAALTVPGAAQPVAPAAGQTLAEYAAAAGVDVEALGAANADATTPFVPGARLTIPGALQAVATVAAAAGPKRTLGEAAVAVGTDLATLARDNASIVGILAPGVAVGAHVTTAHDTLTTLVARGLAPTVAEVAEQLRDLPGLVAPDAPLAPTPPAPVEVAAPIVVRTAEPLVRATTELVATERAEGKADVVDRTPVPPHPDPAIADADAGAAATFTELAAALAEAAPGLHLVVGEKTTPDGALWALALGGEHGPSGSWGLDGAQATCFALPPLALALVSGEADVPEYESGRRPPYATRRLSFADVDLDAWLDALAEAVDLVLSPASTGPAAKVAPDAMAALTTTKERLADALARRVEPVLDGDVDASSRATAREALHGALLERLSAITRVGAIVQVPATVTAPRTGPSPHMTGTLKAAPGSDLGPFTLSPATLPLTGPQPHATFLLSADTPAEQAEARLALRLTPTAIVPSDGSRLRPVLPLPAAELDGLRIPVPLRGLPAPAALVEQEATQSVATPTSAADLRLWDLAFAVEHAAAAQDTVRAEALLGDDVPRAAAEGAPAGALFAALAAFAAVWPALRDDLATLTAPAPGATAAAAVEALAELTRGVADALAAEPTDLSNPTGPTAPSGPSADRAAPRDPTAPRDSDGERVPGDATSHTFRRVGLDVVEHPRARGSVAVSRNAELVPGRQTAPAFVLHAPTHAFAATVGPQILATEPIALAGSGIADALGRFLDDLLTPARGPVPLRLAVVRTTAGEDEEPVIAALTHDLDPATDTTPGPDSFVTQVETAVEAWAAAAEPPQGPGAAYGFDLTVFAPDDPGRPVIRATKLRLPIDA